MKLTPKERTLVAGFMCNMHENESTVAEQFHEAFQSLIDKGLLVGRMVYTLTDEAREAYEKRYGQDE